MDHHLRGNDPVPPPERPASPPGRPRPAGGGRLRGAARGDGFRRRAFSASGAARTRVQQSAVPRHGSPQSGARPPAPVPAPSSRGSRAPGRRPRVARVWSAERPAAVSPESIAFMVPRPESGSSALAARRRPRPGGKPAAGAADRSRYGVTSAARTGVRRSPVTNPAEGPLGGPLPGNGPPPCRRPPHRASPSRRGVPPTTGALQTPAVRKGLDQRSFPFAGSEVRGQRGGAEAGAARDPAGSGPRSGRKRPRARGRRRAVRSGPASGPPLHPRRMSPTLRQCCTPSALGPGQAPSRRGGRGG